jgi:NAD(P) transhydrogenase subunit alpha
VAVRFGVPRERVTGERRVALTPEAVGQLVKDGHAIAVERGAGAAAGLHDQLYAAQGAVVVDGAEPAYAADFVLKVRGPTADELPLLHAGQALAGMLQPLARPEGVADLAGRSVTAFSLDLMPRISRAQGMDVLSAMSTVAGYRAALIAAVAAERFFPMLMTAAGTVTPARVLVLGAGVAGLQAIATARRLGAVVQAFDTRPAAAQQVESLGATFLTVPEPLGGEAEGGYAQGLAADEEERERQVLAEPVARADVVITTAMVPGSRAPLLISEEMVASMHPGAVIVDLAAEAGGNCALTRLGEVVHRHGVRIEGPANLAGDMPLPASQLYARNLLAYVRHLAALGFPFGPDGGGAADLPEDEIARATCLTHAGRVTHGPTRDRLLAGKEGA